MINHTIHLGLDLGARNFLWDDLREAFERLCEKEPHARHAAILILLRRSQELEPQPAMLSVTQGDLPLGVVIDTECEAVLKDDRLFCDRCMQSWNVGETQPECSTTVPWRKPSKVRGTA